MPGFVETERNRQWVPRFAFDQRASATPTGRLATIKDIASAVTFLASDANRSITGEAVRVTGGFDRTVQERCGYRAYDSASRPSRS